MSYTPRYLSTTPNIVSPPLHSYGLGTSSSSNNGNSMDWLGVGSSVISGIGSLLGQASANRANKALAREQMAWQSEENQKAFDRNVQMFNMENAYNDPSAVMERLKNAGVNPFLAFSNGGVGSAMSTTANGNVTTGGVSPVMATQQALPFGAAFEGLSQGIINAANVKKTLAETKGIDLNNDVLGRTVDAYVEKLLSDYELDTQKNVLRQAFATETVNLEQQKLRNELVVQTKTAFELAERGEMEKAQAALNKIETKLGKQKYKFFDEANPLYIKEAQENVKLIGEKVKTEREKQATERSQQGVNWSIKAVNDETKKSIIKDIKNKGIKNIGDAIDVFRKYHDFDDNAINNITRRILQSSAEIGSGEKLEDFIIQMLSD